MKCAWVARYVGLGGNELKNQGSQSIHYVSHQGNQGAGKKFLKKNDKGKRPLMINEASMQIQKNFLKKNDKGKGPLKFPIIHGGLILNVWLMFLIQCIDFLQSKP